MRETITIIIISIIISSCSWFEGPTGPAGDDGVANIYTEEFTISSSNTSASDGVGLNQINISEITPAVIDSGVVKVEYQAIEDSWFGLPWTFSTDLTDNLEVNRTVELNYGYEEGSLYIAHISSYSSLYESDIREGPYKVTILPPTKADIDASYNGVQVQGNVKSAFENSTVGSILQ